MPLCTFSPHSAVCFWRVLINHVRVNCVDSHASVSIWLSRQLKGEMPEPMPLDKWAGSAVAARVMHYLLGGMRTHSDGWGAEATWGCSCAIILKCYGLLWLADKPCTVADMTSDTPDLTKWYLCLYLQLILTQSLLLKSSLQLPQLRRGRSVTITWMTPTSVTTSCLATPQSRSAAARWGLAGGTTVRSMPVLSQEEVQQETDALYWHNLNKVIHDYSLRVNNMSSAICF